MVGTNTLVTPGGDAAVIRIRNAGDEDTGKAIALCTDGNGRMTYLDPFNGGALAVAEAARNCVCVGAVPLALTNCLNFGNPEKPEVYYQLSQAIDGMAMAARALGTPVISGNVSLYNESFGQAIYPTPIVGMVGLIDGRAPIPSAFQAKGDLVILLGEPALHHATLGGSTYLAVLHSIIAGRPSSLDLERELALQRLTLGAIGDGLIRSAHDCSDGGLAVALAECCLWSGLGLQGEFVLASSPLARVAMLFGEAPSRIIVSVEAGQLQALADMADSVQVPFTLLGRVGGDRLTLGQALDIPVANLRASWRTGLSQALGSGSARGKQA
jgi:phosphoribosylformylglycinamidine synthase